MGDLGKGSLGRSLGYLTSLRHTSLILLAPEGGKIPHEVKAGGVSSAEGLPGNPCGPCSLDGAIAGRLRSRS